MMALGQHKRERKENEDKKSGGKFNNGLRGW
jgi:hypothetical protein